jgi:hypothetical protein
MNDSDRLDFINKLLREGNPLMQYYASAHEMPQGGWALYQGAVVIGWGAEQRDAIDHAMKSHSQGTSR